MATKKKSWRKAVREAMYAAAYAEARARTKSKSPPFNYRWEHITAVVNASLKLAALTGADAEIVEAAAWLHDIAKDAKEEHPIEGAKFARDFLPQTNFPQDKIEAVARAIEDHMGLWRENGPLENLESQVLWDADKLTKIGLTAAIHWMGNDLTSSKQRDTLELIARWRSMEWREKTVASMHTESARRAAQERFEGYNRLVDELEREWFADDLV
ncbi:MAG: HD domain-containing protein [Anaerolineae bacterium]|nr:HD domain-containing protein [Anaerolineae bacterium]MCO5192466.1 HD domain-containing protein [Anaerolineae bacterium]MCO5197944.1 HD domain-containing protein [Anaerolineae bacterium]MCO5203412.1 HD domain-containing protein [Anaerolineae bacterium]